MVTLKDISKASGFSTTTVSRALNGYDDVNEKTRRQIRKIADEMGYSPNMAARSLVTKNSKTVGFLVTDLKRSGVKDNFLFETLCGCIDELHNLEYEVIVLTTTTLKQKNKTYLQLCNERNLDGVIIQGLKVDDPYLQEAQKVEKPCVMIDIPTSSLHTGYVTTNQWESAVQAVKYLTRIGHSSIGFINGHGEAHVSIERLKGYKDALADSGIEYRDDYVYNGKFDEETAKQCAISMLLDHPEITAIFCASDVMALGVVKAARELGIDVPGQLSVVGFDNILLSEYITPALTTIAQEPYMMGRAAGRLLVSFIEGKTTERKTVLKNRLILRESTAPPAVYAK